MTDIVYSPDGKFMWSGSEWIPVPPSGNQTLNMQDSVVGGDVVHNTVINNDVDAVTSAVISALERLGIVNNNDDNEQIEELTEIPISPDLEVGMHVEYFSPTNNSWLDRCTVIKINNDGSYDVDVPKSSGIETKQGLVIGSNPGNIRRADDSLELGDRVLVNWKNYGTFFPGKIAEIQPHHTYMIHFDDGDVESGVPPSRIAIQPDSKAAQEYVKHISTEEQELIDAFMVFDKDNSGTINSQELFQILTEMGDPLQINEVVEMFEEMGISPNSEINYKDLAKIMVAPFEAKKEVIIQDAFLEGDILKGFVYGHPKLGDTNVRSSTIQDISYDSRATARVETKNTVYVVGPTGWKVRPDNHPFNEATYSLGQQVKVEWNDGWWDALIREIHGGKYFIHYVGFDSSWDEWVDNSRIKTN